MPPLDHATLQAVLDKQGMPNTTENLNRIAQFAAVAPDMLDKYLGRGTDQSYADQNAGAAIDRSIAATNAAPTADPRLAQLAGPNPYKVTVDQNTGLSNIGPGLVNTPEPRAGGGGQAKPPSIPGDFNAPVGAPPFAKPAAQPQAQGNNLDYLLPSLLPALKYLADKSGINAGGPARAPAPAVPEPVGPWGARQPAPGGPWEGTPAPRPQASAEPAPARAPAPYGSDIQRPNVQAPTQGSPAVPLSDPDRSSPAGRPSGQSQADIEKLRAEAAAEREAAASAEEGKARKLRAEMNARETLKAAGRAVGRK